MKSQFEKYKVHLINFYDNHPQARVSDTVTFLTGKFENVSLKATGIRNLLLFKYANSVLNIYPIT